MTKHETFLRVAREHTAQRFRELYKAEAFSLPTSLRRPTLKWRAWAPEGVVGVFLETASTAREVKEHQRRGLDPYPYLLTTDATSRVAIETSGALNFFASNRVEGLIGFRVKPNASFTLWQHVQVFAPQVAYIVPLGFILSATESDNEADLVRRVGELIDHTLEIWRQLDAGATHGAPSA
jgi:hypothetical protein